MKIIKKDIWELRQDNWWIIVPTNGAVKKDGSNAMGRGVAWQANKLFKGFANAVGNLITKNGNNVYLFERQKLITFPTKNNWKGESDLELIEKSCKQLKAFRTKLSLIDKFTMPKVGCGNGKLDWDKDVFPIINAYFGDLMDTEFMVVDNSQGDFQGWLGNNFWNQKKGKKDNVTFRDIDFGRN